MHALQRTSLFFCDRIIDVTDDLSGHGVHDQAGRALAGLHVDEGHDSVGHQLRAWRVVRKHRFKTLSHLLHPVGQRTVSCRAFLVGTDHHVLWKFGGKGTGLDDRHLDAGRFQFVAIGFAQGFERKLARTVDAHHRQYHSTQTACDLDDETSAPRAHRWKHGAHGAMRTHDVGVKLRGCLGVRHGLGQAHDRKARIVDQHVDVPGLGQNRRDGIVHGFVTAHIQIDDVDVTFSQGRELGARGGVFARG